MRQRRKKIIYYDYYLQRIISKTRYGLPANKTDNKLKLMVTFYIWILFFPFSFSFSLLFILLSFRFCSRLFAVADGMRLILKIYRSNLYWCWWKMLQTLLQTIDFGDFIFYIAQIHWNTVHANNEQQTNISNNYIFVCRLTSVYFTWWI